ncbi:MAG: translation initiation factor IF-2 subunit beta [Candidatus Micrarchaeota archaeon]|nr:translation initiation factor IF-2 subunit beta [Candidatus Micrarchaeota archaeon]
MKDEYDTLLERVYKNIPKHEGSGERFELPDVEVLEQGNKTLVRNFGDLCDVMRREPAVVSKFLSKELAVPSSIDGKRLIFNGKVDSRLLVSKIQDFVGKFVKCKVCNRYDTHISSVDRNTKVLICEACGARAPVRL